MFKSKLSKIIVSLLRRIAGVTRSGAKRLMRAMLQTLMAMGRRARLPVAGFVLPTVTMVLLVVILLTVAITLRSFDRANTARNVRVNQQVLAAATPAIDRAKAKIQFLLQQTQGRGTPSDKDLYFLIANPTTTNGSATDRYTFGDEERLRLKYDLDGTGSITPDLRVNDTGFSLEKNESINTAWRYPVDTNNDGKFDNFTLYGIFFRNPPRDDGPTSPTVGDFLRQRKPLEARTPPVVPLKAGCTQGGGTVASLAGDSGWYRIEGKLKKSFFVYTVNVPMTAKDAAIDPTKYQAFTGTSSISALEYQQDQALIPIPNNAVVYENDLDISPGPPLNLNGRVFTNSNLLVSGLNAANSIKLYQVSSPDSCYYEQENSKIVVSGNVVNGWSGNNAPKNAVDVHLFKKASLPASGRTSFMASQKSEIKQPTGESATNASLEVLYNDEAYTKRLDLLVQAQMGAPLPATGLPDPAVQPSDPFSVRQKQETQTREQALKEYFKQMLRKVPFKEVPLGGDATAGYGLPWSVPPGNPPIEGTRDTLRPVDKWTNLAETQIALTPSQLEATDPSKEPEEEKFLGDRVVAGNNLPAMRWDATKLEFTTEPDKLPGQKWNNTDPIDPNFPRTRSSQVTKIADVGATERGAFWEGAAAEIPKNPLDGVGGLRVITSAGVYERKNSFLPPPSWINPLTGNPATTLTYNDPATPATEEFPVVWPDSMPMSPLGQGSKVYNNSAGGPLNDANWINWPGAATALPAPPAGLPTGTGSPLDPNTPQYAKGDLRMRATAVYHYADNGYDPTKLTPGTEPNQTPIACISSYYDPSTASTARNLSTLPADVSGDTSLGARGTQIGSNNGITYAPPTRPRPATSTLNTATGLLNGGDPILAAQANLVFPDGRFANGPLRKALLLAEDKRTLADKAAIDSTNCALQILKGELAPNAALIPHGAIKEVAFLNGREIKAIDRDDWTTTKVNEAFTLSSSLAEPAKLTGNYNLPLEERQPLEIRATQIDLGVLRGTKFKTDEYLLPNSGIIYASRDDALPDRSSRPGLATGGIDESRSATLSPTDSLLDPTRKPNGILLVNGKELGRNPGKSATVADVVKEKGLTLASNLPVYVKGDFNIHTSEEFNQTVGNWSNFYDRTTTDLNNNFACRPNDPRLGGKCTTGDTWRPANIVSDSVNLLSQNYRFGFRNEGDFDLRNNAGAAAVKPRKQQGFYSNNFVTNGLSSGAFKATSGNLVNTGGTGGTAVTDTNYANTSNPVNSSYFNNFVTPVQRRGKFPEYIMEVCQKIPVSACGESDWFVNPVTGGKATVGEDIGTKNYIAGTTATPPAPELQRFPRRVAFKRTGNALDTPNAPVPLGISGTTVTDGPGTNLPDNSLWFGTTAAGTRSTVTYGSEKFPFVFNQAQKDGSGANLPKLVSTTPANLDESSQPLLMPVLQIQTVTAAPAAASSTSLPQGAGIVNATGWTPKAVNTTFNMVVGSNDTPSRSLGNGIGDFNGGMQNLPRFMESWNSGQISTNIQGSFIQFGRSAYNTAPYIPILDPTAPQQAAPLKLRSLFESPPNPPSPAPVITYTGGTPMPFYRTDNGNIAGKGGRIPFFSPPARNWGYDVGLLSQPPDLFTRKFTTPPSKRTPDEYFREVSRDDEWVQTLLCSFIDDGTGTTQAVTSELRPTDSFCKSKAGA
ncbi:MULTISPECIES: hormogonium polysaccharide biosynthesis protein HpsA [unclassified Microcoleus]|uniref:hormogonium polysaccharide biosynthesis protein HpsA n=1 Tax=unclassified Microcoleus TaxID=2642155 RepID=UPI002FD4960A